MRVLGFGTYDVSVHPRTGIVLTGLIGLIEHGHDVVEVNRPLGFSNAESLVMLRAPWTAYRLVGRLLARWLVLARAAVAVWRHARADAVVVGYLGQSTSRSRDCSSPAGASCWTS